MISCLSLLLLALSALECTGLDVCRLLAMYIQDLRRVVLFLAEFYPIVLLGWRLLDANSALYFLLPVLLAVVVICVRRQHVVTEIALKLDLVLGRVSTALGLIGLILWDLMNFRRVLATLILHTIT